MHGSPQNVRHELADSAYGVRVIASLHGTVLEVAASSCVLDVHGVGYLVHLTPTHALELRTRSEITLVTELVVREDQMTLYGFRSSEERSIFTLLCSVSGVGPKSAMGVLAQLTPGELARAVDEQDAAAFKRVSGVGPKTAKLIIVSLTGKIAHTSENGTASSIPPGQPGLRGDVLDALTNLGYPEKQAAAAVDAVLENEAFRGAPVADVLRAALQQLSRVR